MNFAKAQKLVLNSLLAGARMGRFNIDENHILVTPDGFRVFIFPVSTICFNLEKIKEIDAFPVAEIVKDENELKLTPDCRLDEPRKRTYRRLKGNGKNVFVNISFLDCFQNPRFFQAESSISTVVVTEGAKGANIPVGIILPIRSTWDDGTYYGDTGRM